MVVAYSGAGPGFLRGGGGGEGGFIIMRGYIKKFAPSIMCTTPK